MRLRWAQRLQQAGCRAPPAGERGDGVGDGMGPVRALGAKAAERARSWPEAGRRDPLDEEVRERQDGGVGFRVVRDRSLYVLNPLVVPVPGVLALMDGTMQGIMVVASELQFAAAKAVLLASGRCQQRQ